MLNLYKCHDKCNDVQIFLTFIVSQNIRRSCSKPCKISFLRSRLRFVGIHVTDCFVILLNVSYITSRKWRSCITVFSTLDKISTNSCKYITIRGRCPVTSSAFVNASLCFVLSNRTFDLVHEPIRSFSGKMERVRCTVREMDSSNGSWAAHVRSIEENSFFPLYVLFLIAIRM